MCENSRQRVIHISIAVAVIFLRWQVACTVIGLIADATDSLEAGFWFTAAAMGASGLWVLIAARETLPGLARPE